MIIIFREVRTWPGTATAPAKRRRSTFKRAVDVVGALTRELARLGAARATVSGYWKVGGIKPGGLGLYADARETGPGVVVGFERAATVYEFACDQFLTWPDNLHAITVILEGVRRMERYGVNPGQMLAGFRALPARAGDHAMTPYEAAKILTDNDEIVAAAVLADARLVDVYARVEKAKAHPDAGGSHDAFVRLDRAIAVLRQHHGVAA